jgi:hypothetical protein
MERATLVTFMVALGVALTAGVAVAADAIYGTNGPDEFKGPRVAESQVQQEAFGVRGWTLTLQ